MTSRLDRLHAHLVDLHANRILPTVVEWSAGRIVTVRPTDRPCTHYVLPGFVDAHVHVESTMLTPGQFARAAVVHGTVATVSDPHEIGNVLGIDGVRFMLSDAARAPLKIRFGAPSCVPATAFETAGAVLDAEAVATLLEDPQIGYLSEMMNYPGVLQGDPQVLAKIAAAQQRGKPVDGHAPGLRGADAARYVAAGISTDHECTQLDEALEKLAAGAKIQIREGSAARNFDALFSLIDDHPADVMLCTDDTHPDDLMRGHIDQLVRTAVARGQDVLKVLRCASLNAVQHYGLPVGQLREGDPADFIVVDDLTNFRVLQTYIDGQLVAENGNALFEVAAAEPVNRFHKHPTKAEDYAVRAPSSRLLAIEALDGELVTERTVVDACVHDGYAVADPGRDLLKIAVVNRYTPAPPAVGFIRNFGLRRGALASSVAHDCHNVVAVGTSDAELCAAVNAVIENQGGLAVTAGSHRRTLPLPIAGLMANDTCEVVGTTYGAMNEFAQGLGSSLRAPFMTLSFMALLVIPKLKLSDRGLFDSERFEFVPLFV